MEMGGVEIFAIIFSIVGSCIVVGLVCYEEGKRSVH